MNYSHILAELKFYLVFAIIGLAYIRYADNLFIRVTTAINRRKKNNEIKKFDKNLMGIITKYRQLESSGNAEIPNMSYDEYMNIYEEFLKLMTGENCQYVDGRIFNKFVRLRNAINPYITTKKAIERKYATQSDNKTDLQSQIDELHEDCYENTCSLMENFVQEIEWSFNKP